MLEAYKNEAYLLPKELDEKVEKFTFLHFVRSSTSLLRNKQLPSVSRLKAFTRVGAIGIELQRSVESVVGRVRL